MPFTDESFMIACRFLVRGIFVETLVPRRRIGHLGSTRDRGECKSWEEIRFSFPLKDKVMTSQ